MKRRNFVKQSIAGAIVAASPLALTGLVRADGGGGGVATTETTDFWASTEATVPWESTESTVLWESTEATVASCPEGESIVLWTAYTDDNGVARTGWMCASRVDCPGYTPREQRTKLIPCDNNPSDGNVEKCSGVTELTGQAAVTFKNLPICDHYSAK